MASDPIAAPPFSTVPAPAPAPTPTPAPPPTEDEPPPVSGVRPSGNVAMRSAEDDAEYRENYLAAELINALYALDNGWDGSGVLVGVLDEGVEETFELEGQISNLSKDFGGIRDDGVLTPHESLGGDNSDHGTRVASIIAARNDGNGIQGIAPGASIVVLRSDVENIDTGTSTVGFNSHEALRYAGENGVLIVNRSIAKANPDISNRLMQDAVNAYRQMGGLVVNAAGNTGGANPNDAIDLTPENAEGWLFAVALDPNGPGYELASYSNRCGTAMDRCVAGVGTSATTDVSGNIVSFSGTSAAAPQVSGLAALILHKWPHLTGVDAGNVILATARDIGEAGVDPVFGHGLIDVEAALSPINPTLSNGTTVSSLGSASLILPAAIGDGADGSLAAAISDVTLVDAFGRDYQADLSGFVRHAASGSAGVLGPRFDAMTQTGDAAFRIEGAGVQIGYLAGNRSDFSARIGSRITDGRIAVPLRSVGGTVTADYRNGRYIDATMFGRAASPDALDAYMPGSGIGLAYRRPLGIFRVGASVRSARTGEGEATALLASLGKDRTVFEVGMLTERGTLFGTPTGSGSLRFGDGARTIFAQLSSEISIGSWELAAHGSIGSTRLALGPETVVTDATAITTGRFGIDLSGDVLGGRMRIGLAQPLVALSGTGLVTVGSGFDRTSRSLRFITREIDLSGEIAPRIMFGYERAGPRSSMRLGLESRPDGRDNTVVANWRLRFR
ncbi:S8 family serine peptidase [Erythrobacter sp. 3-20A1M]|uniref:S8 family peptidase n=1 Tax=Erythrobacter sp. 3-20A1M TaxID=2653850 RepID=UPI001BFC07AE|nr:S8 family peptidase [Erythrobacter sp. 3-20A1M]QWC56324.1 S8 family serine peptidase [Erythrobacter sp. 3-20A1M]